MPPLTRANVRDFFTITRERHGAIPRFSPPPWVAKMIFAVILPGGQGSEVYLFPTFTPEKL
jgi:hypothetical protein